MHRASPIALLALVGSLALAGCSGSDECSPEAQKQSVLAITRSWYLYPDLLPQTVDLTQYRGPAELLDALTAGARDQGMDRGWSYLTTSTASQTLYAEGTSVGFGIGLLIRGTQLFVSQVFPGSAAAAAGFARGDEIVAVGEPPADPVPVAQLLAVPDALAAALGPSVPGVTRSFEVIPVGTSSSALRVATKETFSLDPVPVWTTFPGTSGRTFGYVSLRTFIRPADARLTQAFREFQAAGVTDVVVDLRYNGGGLLQTAQLLADLLGGGLEGQVMFALRNNPAHAAADGTAFFAPPAEAIAPLRVAFVTSDLSASASELVPNALEPYASLALVGKRTYGKPVGQYGFHLGACDAMVFLVSFRLVNAQGDGDYFDGLPDAGGAFSGPLCDAEDQLDLPQENRLEASTAAAVQFLETGTCPAPVAVAAGAAAPPADTYPEPPAPTLAQRHVRGLF